MTPDYLAKQIVDHFNPMGKCLEPCRGTGNIYNVLPEADWCEINEGRDFFEYDKHVDWIITNPPFKGVRDWFDKATDLADNIVFLVLMHHIMDWKTKKLCESKGFGMKEIVFVKTPKKAGFPGFQLGCVHYQMGYKDKTTIGELE